MEIIERHSQTSQLNIEGWTSAQHSRLAVERLVHHAACGTLISARNASELAWGPSSDHTESGNLLDPCEQLKLRMLASALFADPAQFLKIASLAGAIEFGPLIQEPGLVRYARAGQSLLILLPDISTETASDNAAADLLTIFYNRPMGAIRDWIVDFSAIRLRPRILFMGTLCSLQESLKRNDASLRFSWLRADLFPEGFGITMRRVFALKRAGDYLVNQ